MTFWDWADRHIIEVFILAFFAIACVASVLVEWARAYGKRPRI